MKRTGIIALITGLSFYGQAQTLEEGVKALDFDRFESARNIFTQLTVKEPTKGANYFYLGQAYWNLYKSDSASWAYHKGIQVEPSNYMNYVGLGELMLDDNKIPDARGYFDKALSFSKGKDGRSKDVGALRLVAEGMVAAENKLADDAVNYISQALEIDKKNYDVYVTAGDVYLEKNDGGQSASSYEKAIDLNKANPKAYTRVANIWLRVKNAEATINELKRALEIDPNYAPALKSLAEYYYQTRQFDKAKETYIKYLQNSEPSVANKQRFARILFRNKEYEEALGQILDIQKTDRSDIFLFRLSGYSHYETGEAKKDTSKYRPGAEALETFMARVDPKKILPNDYEYLGKLYSKIPGKEDAAVSNIKKAIEMDSSKVELLSDAGQIFSRIKKYGDAMDYFERYNNKAQKIIPADYFRLGIAAYNSKQYGKADTAFAKLIEIKPDFADGYYWRGNTQQQVDLEAQTTVAKEMYEKYISLTEATPDKYKRQLINSYTYLGKYAIKKDDNASAKIFFNKVIALDPDNKEIKEYLKQLK